MIILKIFVSSECCNFTYSEVKIEQSSKNVVIAGIIII